MHASGPYSSEDRMPFNIGPLELVIVLVIALLVIGPKRLPEMGNSIGKTIREFRKASSDVSDAVTLEPEAKPAAQQATASSATPASAASGPAEPAAPPSAAETTAAPPAPTEAAPAATAEAEDPARTTSDDA
jgi:TatA/E family protein of Tat protein translocase